MPELEFMFEAEEKVLAFKKENVKCFIVAAGVLYGIEEEIFREHFETSWLQNPPALQYVGNGENKVPAIHVRDLARFVKKVMETKPESPYIFAIDKAKDTRLKTLIEGISQGIGSGQIETNEAPKKVPMFSLKKASYNEVKNEQTTWTNTLQANIWVKPSSLVVKENEGGVEEDQEFEWLCKDGLVANIKKVAQEYCDVYNLKPIKIYVNGPPFSGKTYLSKELAKKYNIIHVSLQDVNRLLKELPANDWLKEEVDEFLKLHPNEEYPKEILCEGYKRILRQNACIFRGYVLDGFPRSYSEAKALFYTIPRKPKKKAPEVKKEGEENADNPPAEENQPEDEEQKPKIKFEKDIYPHSFIMFNCDEQFVMDRYTKSSQKIGPMELAKRLQMYNMLNNIDSCSIEEQGFTVWNFFQEKKDEIMVFDLRSHTDYTELSEAVRLYVERNGRPYNFLDSEAHVVNAREAHIKQMEQEKREAENDRNLQEEKELEQQKKARENKASVRLKIISGHVQEVQEAQEVSARYFLRLSL